jgi:hypothetical protein
MSFIKYFDLESVIELQKQEWHSNSIGSKIEKFDEQMLFAGDAPTCTLLFVGKPKHVHAFELLRSYFYSLYVHHKSFSMADLGDFDISQEAALASVIKHLISIGTIPIIISPYKQVAYHNYVAYCELGKNINATAVDSLLGFGIIEDDLSESNYLAKIIEYTPNHLFHLTNFAYQTYLNNPEEINSYEKLNFDAIRLGQLRDNIETVEPVMRNTDMLCFNMSSIRSSDAQHISIPMPNGLYAEEACRIIRYAGISNKLSSAGIYGLEHGREAKDLIMLIAQLVWHLTDGIFNRTSDGSLSNTYIYTKYVVDIPHQDIQIIFYKHNFNEKWWMQIPAIEGNKKGYVLACSYSDYEKATKGDLPGPWWNTFRKLV